MMFERSLKRWGVGRVVLLNWPKYVAAVSALALGVTAVSYSRGMARLEFALLCALIAYGTAASLLATWWVYDHEAQRLYQRIADHRHGTAPWVLVHAGFDESHGRLHALLGPPAHHFDIGPSSDRSRSLRRAHALSGRDGVPVVGALPVGDASIGLVVVLFGIHELHSDSDAVALLRELTRITVGDGSVVIVEHLIDVANIVAYGPAAWHFSTGGRWRNAVTSAGMRLKSATRVGGLVTVMVAR